MDDNDVIEFARQLSKDLANRLTQTYPQLVDIEDLDNTIFEYFKERNENRGRG